MTKENKGDRRRFLGSVVACAALASDALAHAEERATLTPKGTTMTATTETRYARGWRKLQEVDGHAGESVVESRRGIAPDLGRYLIEFPFGDIYARPGLDLRSREIATVAALTALGNARPQLKVHLNGALNVGVSRTELVEVIMQMAVYAGFPAALNAIFAAQEVFYSRPAKE